MTNKYKVVKITVNGVQYEFKFYPVYDNPENPEQLFCTECPLYNFCDLINNPKDPDNPETSFMDFCVESGNQDLEKIVSSEDTTSVFENLVPEISDVLKYVRGTGSDVYQKIIKKDPYLKLSDVIDAVCGEDGFTCPSYNKEHTNCSSSNGLCVLRRFFPTN